MENQKENKTLWHLLTIHDVLNVLQTTETGLSSKEANKRLLKSKSNTLPREKPQHWSKILIEQVSSPLVLILIFAVIITFLAHEYLDASIIFLVIILNTFIGFSQELKALKEIESLQNIKTQKTLVSRDQKELIINSEILVPGDIVLLSAGDRVPADLRITNANSLRVDEAILTGESVPRDKNSNKLNRNVPLADRDNMLYANTMVVAGKCRGIVVNTGSNTEFGQIAFLVQKEIAPQTPLQKKMYDLAKLLGLISVCMIIPIFIIGYLRGLALLEIFQMGISLGVSAVPEGLPIIITLTLAFGVKRILKQNALIKKLPAVEVLGSCDVICTDKTGTLTTGQMTLKEIYTNTKAYFFEKNKEETKILEQKLTKKLQTYRISII